MDDKLRTIEFDTELSPEEEAAIDRLLTEAAEADDSEVDYPAMLARIKAAAKEEGIVIFPSRKEKRARIVKRVFTGFAAVAAVFFEHFRNNKRLGQIMTGVRPACVGMVAGVIIDLALVNYSDELGKVHWPSLVLGIVDLILLIKFKVSIPKVLLFSAIVGIILYGVIGL